MKKQKSMGNKGFSLVELIIVIAIMAILVGVLAPNLLRYVEKTNVSADTQLADSVKTAITTAMMDPAVINATDNSASKFVTAHSTAYASISSDLEGAMFDSVKETMGSSAANAGALKTELIGKLKSAHDATGADIQVQIVGSNAVQVKITTTDSEAKKNTSSTNPIEVK